MHEFWESGEKTGILITGATRFQWGCKTPICFISLDCDCEPEKISTISKSASLFQISRCRRVQEKRMGTHTDTHTHRTPLGRCLLRSPLGQRDRWAAGRPWADVSAVGRNWHRTSSSSSSESSGALMNITKAVSITEEKPFDWFMQKGMPFLHPPLLPVHIAYWFIVWKAGLCRSCAGFEIHKTKEHQCHLCH